MKGMEQEKYLKPHFSKCLRPMMDFVFHNADFYNIPDTYRQNKPGPFKFPDELLNSPGDKSIQNIDSDEHLGNNKTAQKIKLALRSAKKSKNKIHKNRDYSHNQSTIRNIQDLYRRKSKENSMDYDLIYSSSAEPKYSSISKRFNANKTLRNTRSIDGEIATSMRRKQRMKKDYQKYYKSKKPIYLSIKPKDLTQIGRTSLEQSSEFVSTISRPFLKSREKSAHCVNRKLRDTQTSFNKNQRNKDQNKGKRRNIRTARPQSIRKNKLNKRGLVDKNQSDMIAVEDKGYPG